MWFRKKEPPKTAPDSEFVRLLMAMRDHYAYGIPSPGSDKEYGPGHPWTDLCRLADEIITPYEQGRMAYLRGYPREGNPHAGNPWDIPGTGIDWLEGWDDAESGICPNPDLLIRELAAMFIQLRDDQHCASYRACQQFGVKPPSGPEEWKQLHRRISRILGFKERTA